MDSAMAQNQTTRGNKMTKITKQYANPRNGGQERVIRDGEKFFINSDFGNGFTRPNQQVTREQMEMCLRFSSRPAEVFAEILSK